MFAPHVVLNIDVEFWVEESENKEHCGTYPSSFISTPELSKGLRKLEASSHVIAFWNHGFWYMFLQASHYYDTQFQCLRSRKWHSVELVYSTGYTVDHRGTIKRHVSFPSCFLILFLLGCALGMYMSMITNFMTEVWHLGHPGIGWWFFAVQHQLK